MQIILFIIVGFFLWFDAKLSLDWWSNQDAPSPTLSAISTNNLNNAQTFALVANLYFRSNPVNTGNNVVYIYWNTLKSANGVPLALAGAPIPSSWYVATAKGKWALCMTGIDGYSLSKIAAWFPEKSNNVINDTSGGAILIGVDESDSYASWTNLCKGIPS